MCNPRRRKGVTRPAAGVEVHNVKLNLVIKMKKDLTKHIGFINDRIKALEEVKNSISEEARAEIEGRIGQLRELASDLEALRDTNAEGEEDHSEEMLAQMREVLARVEAVENAVKTDNVENSKEKKKMVKNSKDYEKKFYNYVMSVTDSKEFRKGLNDFAVQNDITVSGGNGLADLLPAAVLKEINDIFTGHRHRLLEIVDWTGLPVFKAMWETGNVMGNTWPSPMLDQEASAEPKTEQQLTLNPIVIRPQYVYKYITVDKEMVRASEDEGRVLIRYIARELLDRLLCTIEGYILNGNGNNFISPNAVSLLADANTNPLYHSLNYLPYNDGLVAVVTSDFYASLLREVQVNSNYIMAADADVVIRNILGVDEVILAPPGFTATQSGSIGLWFLNPRDYKMVGDRRPDEYEDFNLAYNKKEYLTEIWIGGGCVTDNFICITDGK